MFLEINLINQNYDFINSIILSDSTYDYLSYALYGSNERYPLIWENIPSSADFNIAESRFNINLRQPQNYLHFKIEINWPSYDLSKLCAQLVPFIKREDDATHQNLKHKRIAFLCCVRDCESALKESIDILAKLGSQFKNFKIFIFENDSKDATLNIIKKLMDEFPIDLTSHKNLDSFLPLRVQRLSHGRNYLLNKISNLDFDYFCVADMDGVFSKNFNPEHFFDNFKYDECWDAVFPVNSGIYYDIWAFRHETLWDFDYEEKMNQIPTQFEDQNILKFYIDRIQKFGINDVRSWLRVNSAFGGMGIYKAEKFIGLTYKPINQNNRHTCEHVPFHEQAVRLGRKIYINPYFRINGINS